MKPLKRTTLEVSEDFVILIKIIVRSFGSSKITKLESIANIVLTTIPKQDKCVLKRYIVNKVLGAQFSSSCFIIT